MHPGVVDFKQMGAVPTNQGITLSSQQWGNKTATNYLFCLRA